jgi:predicted metal-dependent HD superfamily phosphohydrolase
MVGTMTPEAELRVTLEDAWGRLATNLGNPDHLRPLGTALLDSWGGGDRHYHDLTHLQHVLRHVEDLADHADDPTAVRLAAWYHDAVYDGAPDDEERSAQRATAELGSAGLAPDLVEEVARLVRLTARHDPAPGDRNGEVLCDADLAVLAGDERSYAAYVAAVRAEYAHVPDDAFRSGRADVLRALLTLPGLFHTPHGRAQWEPRARANLTAELTRLDP